MTEIGTNVTASDEPQTCTISLTNFDRL